MARLADLFNIEYTRPFSELNVVSIAELAQFTCVEYYKDFPVSRAYDQLREEWKLEIDEESAFYYVDFKKARAAFCDGSTLTFERK